MNVPRLVLLLAALYLNGCTQTPNQANHTNSGAVDDVDSKNRPKLTLQEICISQFRSGGAQSLTQPDRDVAALVHKIVEDLGSNNYPNVVPCEQQEKAEAYVFDVDSTTPGAGIPEGEYVIYNPTWVREVVGENKPLEVALFGHEVGHLINRDFTAQRNNVDVLSREKDADYFGGCALAREGYPYSVALDLFSRIRATEPSDHPDRLASLDAARRGYIKCGGDQCRIPENGIEGYQQDVVVTETSDVMQGGHSQPEFCAKAVQKQKGLSRDATVSVVSSSEKSGTSCAPGNCTTYQYFCNVRVQSGPIYKLARSDNCLESR